MECLKTIKCKYCEGYDRIPQSILFEGAEIFEALLRAFLNEFTRKIESQNNVIPIHKKGKNETLKITAQ